MGPTDERLGYKRMILDLHFGTHRPNVLHNVDPEEIAEMMATAGIDSLLNVTRDQMFQFRFQARNRSRAGSSTTEHTCGEGCRVPGADRPARRVHLGLD